MQNIALFQLSIFKKFPWVTLYMSRFCIKVYWTEFKCRTTKSNCFDVYVNNITWIILNLLESLQNYSLSETFRYQYEMTTVIILIKFEEQKHNLLASKSEYKIAHFYSWSLGFFSIFTEQPNLFFYCFGAGVMYAHIDILTNKSVYIVLYLRFYFMLLQPVMFLYIYIHFCICCYISI